MIGPALCGLTVRAAARIGRRAGDWVTPLTSNMVRTFVVQSEEADVHSLHAGRQEGEQVRHRCLRHRCEDDDREAHDDARYGSLLP